MNSPTRQPPFDFRGATAVVTGSGGGLGRGIARAFAAAGAAVVVHCRNNASRAGQVVADIEQSGGRAMVVQADLSQRDGAERLMGSAIEAFGSVEVLVNNAGSYPVSPMLEIEESEWRSVVGANLDSAFFCTQVAASLMRTQSQAGAIINIASVEGSFPAAGHCHYNAAKAGVIMLTRSSAYELGRYGIRVNAVSPGLIARDGIEEAWPEGVAAWKRAAPISRLGEPGEIAAACLFLASPWAGWISGTNLVIDGGASCRPVF